MNLPISQDPLGNPLLIDVVPNWSAQTVANAQFLAQLAAARAPAVNQAAATTPGGNLANLSR